MKKIFFLFTLFIPFIACRKTPDEKIVGKWKIESVFVNGNDVTSNIDSLKISYYEFVISEVGSDDKYYLLSIETSANWINSCFVTSNVIGMYSVSKDKSMLNISISNGFRPCMTGKSFIPGFIKAQEEWEIKKWKRSDLELQFSYNGNTYETKFKRVK